MLTESQARDLVAWAGGINAAAREVGVPHTTLRYWLNPEYRERHRERMREYRSDPEYRERERERRSDPEYRERERERRRERYRSDPEYAERHRKRQLERYYSLSGAQYSAWRLRQDLRRREKRAARLRDELRQLRENPNGAL